MLHQDWCGGATDAAFLHRTITGLSRRRIDADIKKTWDIADDAFKAVKSNMADRALSGCS